MTDHYNRQGEPMSFEDWVKAFETGNNRVNLTTLPDGKVVSTVWLGLDHRFGAEGPPMIFETMVFPSDGGAGEVDCERYSTEPEAIGGHQRMVDKYTVK